MTWLEWILSGSLLFLYLALLFTVCLLTFRKGRVVLGVLGFIFPFLWLVGAVIPARQGSRYDREERERLRNLG